MHGKPLESRSPVTRETVAIYPIIDLPNAGRHPEALVGAALRAGATILQFRDKRPTATYLYEVVCRTRHWLEEARVPLIINDRLALALSIGADGVHLGQSDLSAAEARALATAAGRPDLAIGISVTTAVEATMAMAQGATYLSVSPVFGTPTKADIARPAGLEGIAAIRAAHASVPLVTIGGLRPELVAPVLHAGADGVAFISAFSAARHPEATLRAFARAVHAVQRERHGADTLAPPSPRRPQP